MASSRKDRPSRHRVHVSAPGVVAIPDEPKVARHLDIEQVRAILPQLIDSLSDAVLVVDRDRRVVAANRRYVEAFGLRGTEAVGVLCHEAVTCPEAGASEDGIGCAACEVLSLKAPRRLMRTLADEAGALLRWEVTLNPVLDRDGNVTHVVEVWRDVTVRSQLESQLSHSERLASLGMLAAGVAHEINNPMASISAGVESLQRWLKRATSLPHEAAAEVAEVLEMIERETLRSRDITDKLLLLAQPYQGVASWVSLNEAVQDTINLLRYQMGKQGITTEEQLDPELPQIWARGSGIRGVLMNLCMNAVQAMPDGGTLSARTRRQGEHVVVEVADSGTGIHPANLERIWDPFFTTKPVGKGTGLGLSITQRVVSRHGGNIRVESMPGRGARFIVTLPVQGPGGEHV